jgi:16S rRNA processing protein RimM
VRLIPFGEIVTTHGLDGWLKLNPFNPETTALSSIGKIYLEKGGISSEYELESSKPYRKQFLIKLRGVDGIGEAEKRVGSTLCIAEEELPKLEFGEFYLLSAVGPWGGRLKGQAIGIITAYGHSGENSRRAKGCKTFHPGSKERFHKVTLRWEMVINCPTGF